MADKPREFYINKLSGHGYEVSESKTGMMHDRVEETFHVVEYSAYELMKHDCVKAEMTAHHMNEHICELKAKLDMAIEALEIYKNIDNYDIEGGFNYDDYETTSWDYAKQTLERLK